MAKKKLYDEQGNEVKGAKVKKPFYKKVWFWVLAAIVVFLLIPTAGEDEVKPNSEPAKTEVTTNSSENKEEEVAEDDTTEVEEVVEEEPEEEKVPREHRNALSKAENYLSFAGMSETGLRDQLEFEEFPQDAIDYAIENVDADYNEQALEKARSYDDFASMSDQGLKDQLIFEGFTEEQAQYAIDNLE